MTKNCKNTMEMAPFYNFSPYQEWGHET